MQDNPVSAHTWLVGLDSWIVQDGNYRDFVTGERAEFALEFASRGGLRLLEGVHRASVRWIEGSQYEVTAQIVHDKPNAHVLDLGVLAYHFIGIEDPMHQPRIGAWVTGEVNLSVDPFFYFDQLAHEEGFPALIYTWTVQEILQKVGQGAPHIEAAEFRDDTSRDFVRIEKTDVWGDVSTSPSYLLRCRMEPDARSTARSLDNP
ncbi:hypothetical protein [Nocardioides mesophilus]|uniref:Uncharacterized protein n=1 Tax=Nocardioides mesophilus TaxID=433659 RepID=A0A7G9RDS4_9ACTN|nr:hypothetical protein [Nocardioides mesophilus]QNN53749.1 hypothetical protein H9L09_04875 [Nocardioides mesophilus]